MSVNVFVNMFSTCSQQVRYSGLAEDQALDETMAVAVAITKLGVA